MGKGGVDSNPVRSIKFLCVSCDVNSDSQIKDPVKIAEKIEGYAKDLKVGTRKDLTLSVIKLKSQDETKVKVYISFQDSITKRLEALKKDFPLEVQSIKTEFELFTKDSFYNDIIKSLVLEENNFKIVEPPKYLKRLT